MKQTISRKLALTLCFLFFFSIGFSAIAADPYGLKQAASGTGVSEAQLTGQNSIIAIIIKNVLAMVGVIFLILLVWGGVMWMTSGGNEQSLSKAKSIITTATIGLVIVLSAYAITTFVVESLTQVQQPIGGGPETQ